MQNVSKTPSIRTIEQVIDETPTVRTFVISDNDLANVLPGQFAMVWIPGVNEIPMSIMVMPENGKAAFTVRKRGVSSSALYDLKVGQQIGVRGPYGNSFDIKDGKIALVGGGTGLVPLLRLAKFAKSNNEVVLLMGSKSKDEVFFEQQANQILKNHKHQIISCTEDGTYGEKGFVTDVLGKLLETSKFDAIYTCGPEIMMHKIVQMANSKGIFVQASLERMMKCGIGICGSCCMDDVMVCHDGTVFDGGFLANSKEFGHTHRAKSGILENY